MLTKDDWNEIFCMRDIFIKELKGYELYEYQKIVSDRIIRSVLNQDGETYAVQFTRQAGKTTCVVDTVTFLFIYFFQICKVYEINNMGFFNVGFFAPQIDQSKTDFNLLRDNLKKCQGMGYDFNFNEFNCDTIHMVSNSYPKRMAYCFTASPTSHPESKTLNLIVYEESQDLDDKQIDKAIAPMGASTNATEVFIGVGGYRRCRFWELLQKLGTDNKLIIPYNMVLEEHNKLFELY